MTSSNLRLNFLFLITILRLDILKTFAKPQDQINLDQLFNDDNFLVHDTETSTNSIMTIKNLPRATSNLDNKNLENFTTTTEHNYGIKNNNENINNLNNLNDKNLKKTDLNNKNERSFSELTTELNNYYTTPRLITAISNRHLTRHDWLSKEYFSYLCASENCIENEIRDRIQDNCFSKHSQLNSVIMKCLNNGKCDNYSKSLNCILNESRKDPLLIPLVLHDCVDGLVSMKQWKCIRREQLTRIIH